VTQPTSKDRFNSILPRVSGRPSPQKHYRNDLDLVPSVRRPFCVSGERLRLWLPTPPPSDSGLGYTASSSASAERVLDFMNNAYAPGTRETYGTGLLVFHVFCDQKVPPVPEYQRGPASEALIMEFISSCATTSGDTAKNYTYGVKAWHTIHGLPWTVDETRLSAALTAAERVAPGSCKRPARPPLVVSSIAAIHDHLNLELPLDAAVFACLTTTFWSCSRLGEFTVPSLKGFKSSVHVKPCNVVSGTSGASELPLTSFHLPWTKVSKHRGESVHWAPQDGVCDPHAAFVNHLHINAPPVDAHLFSYMHTDGKRRPLTRSNFLKRINTAAAAAGLQPIQGHSLRIGSVLEYLLRGLSFETVKMFGRWTGDLFKVYLRRHATIVAPYIQNTPLHEPFLRTAMQRCVTSTW
jgi:hypothetical protein